MIFNVVISIQAEKDLRGIFEYIVLNFCLWKMPKNN